MTFPLSLTNPTTGYTSEDILATVKTLRARARKEAQTQKAIALAPARAAHLQIARRRIADAALFAYKNIEHAEKCCWEARTHLNFCEY